MAQEGHYRLPDGALPVVESDDDIIKILQGLVSPKARLALRKSGLQLAAKYSAAGVARQLVHLHETGLDSRGRGVDRT
eukprot:1296027-Amphidinium_carterae.1